ncbi:NAD(P)-dependent oxidoreductase [Solirubrobacter phytolaccae]|uniref:NAD(P)-dependent oxidoreductase n=1 Tax=Solirubrobacter phytolaccae TaxID=1404360 RepID=A0A9X3N4A9_9ACTN|nr:NAD(P)-dependent oxidoreductase [Solirubrobacter phytolaccae]MDA0179369.1 NAD(P)-dependent oxidoreductase [Solirubrobacter phytolaccae]
MTRVGWIGLGAMGGPMAACAARAGFEIVAFDADPSRIEGKAAASVAEAAGEDIVVVMVATADQADEVLRDVPTETLVVMMSTVGPAAVQRWAERWSIVDAPVSGGVARAGEGDLLIMVAGEDSRVERVRPLLDALARSAPVVGSEPGDGQKVKLVNQLLCGVHIAAAAEALAFAEALGLDAGAVREIVRDGAAASFMLDDRGERMVQGAFDEVKSALDIFVKDMGLVTDAARATAYPAPLASAAEQLYVAGRRAGLGRSDDASLIRVLRGDT